jgi:hypothetical protein
LKKLKFERNKTNSIVIEKECTSGFSTSPKNKRKIWERNAPYCGEDAFFTSYNEKEKLYAFGIAGKFLFQI